MYMKIEKETPIIQTWCDCMLIQRWYAYKWTLISTVSRSSSEVKRKYGFAGKEDFDIFGRNKLFAPRIKWEALKVIAENVKNSAKEYEVAFNGIKASIENKGDITQVGDWYLKLHES